MNSLSTIPDLLLAALSQTLPSDFAKRLTHCSAEEWTQLVTLATEQQVAALLYYRLKAHGVEALLPAEIRQQLQKSYRSNTLRNIKIYHALGQVANGLQAQAIPVIILKGAHLATAVYENRGLRSMADLDIWVAQEQIPKVVELLHAMGYCTTSEKDATAQSFSDKHIAPMVKENLKLEVHRSILESQSIAHVDPAEFWSQAIPVKAVAAQTLGLCPEHLLLHLCIHMTYGHLLDQGVRALCDIDTLIRRYQHQLNWRMIAQCADRWHCGRGVYLALYLTKSLLATPITDEQLAFVAVEPLNPQTVQAAVNHLFAPKGETSRLPRNFLQLWHAQDWVTRIQIFLRRLFLPRQHLAELYAVPVDSPRLYLYYLLRLSYFWRRYWRLLIRLGRGEQELSERAQRKNQMLTWLEP